MLSIDPEKLDQTGLATLGPYHALMPAQLEPTDIANLALFLASDKAAYLTGAIIAMDGGAAAVI